jgi:hypothetical protein
VHPIFKYPVIAQLALLLASRIIACAEPQESPANAPIVQMDPFFVSGNEVKWRYARAPGYELLSSYPDQITREFLQELSNAQAMLDFIVPRQFQAKFDVPEIIILCDNEVMSPTYEDILSLSSRGSIAAGRQDAAQSFLNLRVADKDRIALLVANQARPSVNEITLTGIAHVRFLLDRRTPRLPPWLVTGIMNLYLDLYAANQSKTVTFSQQATDLFESKTGSFHPQVPDTIQQPTDFIYHIPPFVWVSPEISKKIKPGEAFFGRDASDSSRVMNDLFTRDPPTEGTDWEIWNARATLFVRWALDREHHSDRKSFGGLMAKMVSTPESEGSIIDGTNSPHRDAFWKYVVQAAAGPVTEASFKECFGLSYSEAARQLSGYVPAAIGNPIDVLMEKSTAEAPHVLREASSAEITRIKGDWERMALNVVRKEYHDYASDRIKEMLMRAHKRGLNDPRLLAVIGLFDCDLGDDAGAKGFLEAAVQANVVGPRAYYELARIRYGELMAGGNGPPSAADVERIIEPLETGRSQSPSLLESYELAEKVMEEASGADVRLHLNYLDSVRRDFPRELDLLYKVASLNVSNGYASEASALAEAGVQLSTTPQDRARFAKLKVQATQTPEPNGPSEGGK